MTPGDVPPPPSASLRILLVSQFWPSDDDPDYGVFVKQVADGLVARGHVLERAVVDHRGAGRKGDARLLQEAAAKARAFKPDVVFGHFLLPAGVAAAAASVAARAPLVVMAHGQDVRNAVDSAVIRRGTALVVRRADTVIFNSAHLRDLLPLAPKRTAVIDCGVDLEAFAPHDGAAARAGRGLADAERPVFLFAGSLIERKNVVRLRDAFAEYGQGTLVVLGDGPLRDELEGRASIRLEGRVAYADVPGWMAAADVLCLPSLEEPLGQVLLEAMASERSVVATRIGGPPEFVPHEAGALVDPHDTRSILAGLEHAAGLPSPNPAARRAAAEHDVKRQVARMEAVLASAAGRA